MVIGYQFSVNIFWVLEFVMDTTAHLNATAK